MINLLTSPVGRTIAALVAGLALVVGLYLWVDHRGYSRGFAAAEARHALDEAIARKEYIKEDLARQEIENGIDALARQSQEENHAAPIANSDALGVDRVRRINKFRP